VTVVPDRLERLRRVPREALGCARIACEQLYLGSLESHARPCDLESEIGRERDG
jgi:hypothetical protein